MLPLLLLSNRKVTLLVSTMILKYDSMNKLNKGYMWKVFIASQLIIVKYRFKISEKRNL